MNLPELTKTALLTGAPFGIFMGLVDKFYFHFEHGLVVGAAAGLIFGVFMGIVSGLKRRRIDR